MSDINGIPENFDPLNTEDEGSIQQSKKAEWDSYIVNYPDVNSYILKLNLKLVQIKLRY
jgi:1,4-alpha-glucan branching enzyme